MGSVIEKKYSKFANEYKNILTEYISEILYNIAKLAIMPLREIFCP